MAPPSASARRSVPWAEAAERPRPEAGVCGGLCEGRGLLADVPAVGVAMSALPRSYNPFAEDEEEDVAPAGPGGAGGADRQRFLQQEVLRRSAATADSTTRSLSLLFSHLPAPI